jgi:hypothetical protein
MFIKITDHFYLQYYSPHTGKPYIKQSHLVLSVAYILAETIYVERTPDLALSLFLWDCNTDEEDSNAPYV